MTEKNEAEKGEKKEKKEKKDNKSDSAGTQKTMWNRCPSPLHPPPQLCTGCHGFHAYGSRCNEYPLPSQPAFPSQYAYYPRQHGPDVALGNYQYPPGYQGHWGGRPHDFVRAPPNSYYPTHQGRPMYPPVGPACPPARPYSLGPSATMPPYPLNPRSVPTPTAVPSYLHRPRHEAELAAEAEHRALRNGLYEPMRMEPVGAKPDQEFECRNPADQRVFMTYANIKNGYPDGVWRTAPTGQPVFYMNRFHSKMPEMESDSSDD